VRDNKQQFRSMTSYRANGHYHPHNCFCTLSAILEVGPKREQVQKQPTLHNMLIYNYYSNDKHLPYLDNTEDTENDLRIFIAVYCSCSNTTTPHFHCEEVFHTLLIGVTVFNGAIPNTEHYPSTMFMSFISYSVAHV
jgi:hypothetical protein